MNQDNDKNVDKSSSLIGDLKNVFRLSKRQPFEKEIKELLDDNIYLHEDEKRMIGDILSLDKLTAEDIMRPRVDIIAIEYDNSIRNTLERMRGTGYSRLPVYRDDLDHIVGIAYYKDLIGPLIEGKSDVSISDFMHSVSFVPNSKDLIPLLSEMQSKREQMVIVVDEYGGTDGLITIEDIVEEIVGEIIDETDYDIPFVDHVEGSIWIVDGRCTVKEALELKWPVEESDNYDTIAGWYLDNVDTVPQVGERIVRDGFIFKVLSMRRQRIKMLHVEKLHQIKIGDKNEQG